MKLKGNKNSFFRFLFGGASFLCLFLGFFIIFSVLDSFFKKNSAQSIPLCASIPLSTSITPGTSCYFFPNLPLCSSLVGQKYPRENCADIIHLPLCSALQSSAIPGRNCVKECSDSSFNNSNAALIRGQDYAIHNRECIRFCDTSLSLEGIAPRRDVNCAERMCHQIEVQDLIPIMAPDPGNNCNILTCNLLTPDELRQEKFQKSEYKYCSAINRSGDKIKCFSLTQDQLQYAIPRLINPTCFIHKCTPLLSSCGVDEVAIIKAKGTDYEESYKRYINGTLDLSSTTFCEAVPCRPMAEVQYRCVSSPQTTTFSGDSSRDIFLNPQCSATIKSPTGIISNQTCQDNYCVKQIDCNTSSTDPNCQPPQQGGQADSTYVDPFDSWFYRPVPLDKATVISGQIRIPREMNQNASDYHGSLNNLCYSRRQMEDIHGWGNRREIDLGLFTIDMGWFHDYLGMDSRSPGWCGARDDGNRGTGYSYLCGTSGNLYSRPSEHVSYYAGYIRTIFENNNATHKIRICTRFKNTITLSACGERECGITGAFVDGSLGGAFIRAQTCGGDVCDEFEITDDNPTKCMMDSSHANNTKSSSCSHKVDLNVRLRAVKYGDYICGFLDSKGQLAYNGMFFDGDEVAVGNNCVSDANGSLSSGCNGHNSNSDRGLADKWRTVLQIPYVKNNQPDGRKRGYLDRDGRFYPEQVCPKVTLRIPPPKIFNLANISNSEKLFTPPLFIKRAFVIKNGDYARPSASDSFGKTDFHYPEIEVQYGTQIAKMSLNLDDVSGDSVAPNSASDPSSSSKKLTITVSGRSYDAEIYLKKEFYQDTQVPVACLYRKIKDINGNYVNPYKVGCVFRQRPFIDNNDERVVTNNSIPVRKVLVEADPSNQFNSSKISYRYIAPLSSSLGSSCGSGSCTAPVLLENADYSRPTCVGDSERYSVCAQRDDCSRINIECMQNEIDLNNALNEGRSDLISSLQSIRYNCNNSIIPACNSRNGIPRDSSINLYNLSSSQSLRVRNAYGWFNELCLVKGFGHDLKNIVAYQLPDELMGKCAISPNSPYLNDANPATNCDEGGRAPNCLCVEAVDGFIPQEGFVIRKQTNREAGLCIDMPTPRLCPQIDFNTNPNILDIDDPEYQQHSLGKMFYNDSSAVHSSHQKRSGNVNAINGVNRNYGHAEFASMPFGVNNVRGTCNGYWTYQTNSFGIRMFPKLNCINSQGDAVWDTENIVNPCVRYSCPESKTDGPEDSGEYPGLYDYGEVGVEDKGRFNGFANWNKFTKTNDFMEYDTAESCIFGFKPVNSAAILDRDSGAITGYSGGNKPTRACNQLGSWQRVENNVCERIKCPAINNPIPTSSSDSVAWSRWFASGGANFPSVNASRSNIRIQRESVSTGSCNNSLGFYQTPGGRPPTRECDYLGNWGEVINPCTTQCDEVGEDEAGNLNNGFAKWRSIGRALNFISAEGTFNGCKTSYVTYPYPPEFGPDLQRLSNADDLTRPLENPKRLCKVGITPSGSRASVWEKAVNGCINECPSVDYDSRIGVGRTVHATSSGSVTVRWRGAPFNTYQYETNWSGSEANLDASSFLSGRTNGIYLLRRYCNSNGKWSEPEAMCSLNNGVAGNAQYSLSSIGGYSNSMVAKKTVTISNDFGSSLSASSFSNDSEIPMQFSSSGPATGCNKFIKTINVNISNLNLINGLYLRRTNISNPSDYLYFDDILNIKVNNVDIFQGGVRGRIWGSTNFDSARTCEYSTHYRISDTIASDLNLKPYLTSGVNTIQIRVGIAGGGGFRIALGLDIADDSPVQSQQGICLSPNYWKNNFNRGTLPSRVCSYGASQNIDQVYLALTNNDCERIRCQVPSNYIGQRAYINGDTSRTSSGYSVGEVIQGSCLNNQRNINQTLIYSSLFGQNPQISCQANGSWSNVENESNCKIGCDALAWGTATIDIGGCGGSSDTHLRNDAHSLQHGQVLEYYSTDSCGGRTVFYLRAMSCNDGNFMRNDWFRGTSWANPDCRGSYRFPQNDFNGPNRCIYASWKSTPNRQQSSYIDKTNTPRNTSDIIHGWVW